MRLSYTDILNAHFRNIGKAGQTTDPILLADFQYNLGQRYQTILGAISSYINEDTLTASTVASQQYYYYPPGIQTVDNVKITIGSISFTLSPIYDLATWNQLNSMTIQPTAIPQFIFPRKSDFGIWPIPSAVYTITMGSFMRDRNLLVDDYTAGTVALTLGSATVTGTSTTFIDAMIGRWFTVTSTTVRGRGYWYRIAGYTSANVITLDTTWAGPNTATASYRIGESPELPEEAHIILPDGTASDYYAGLRNDSEKANEWDNKFWTGSRANESRDVNDKNISAGLIGLIKQYKNRDRSNLIYKTERPMSPYWKVFSTTIS